VTTDYFKNKKVLVAGAAGFVGTNLINCLISQGAQVRGTLFTKKAQLHAPDCEYVKCDLTQLADCIRVTKDIDFVFMVAANSSGAEVIDKTPLVHLTPNIVMNAHMLAGSYENCVKKFCFISSNVVYPLTDFAVKEDDARYEYFDKYFIVGWMKQFTEIMCEMYSSRIKSPMETIVVRPGNLYGPFDKYTWKDSKVIAALIRRAIEKQNPFEIWGDGSDIKDFLYIDDFIDGLLTVFKLAKDHSPVNLASGMPVNIRETLAHILNAANYSDADIRFDSSKPSMIPVRMIDITCANSQFHWAPSTSLEQGIKKTIEWYRDYYKINTPEERS
jgi:GDP-L-fucose synthase